MEQVTPSKIRLPRLRADLVPRPRLQARLRDALTHRKLVLLSAPAGFGKTVALVQQLGELPEGHAVAWVSAGEDDDLQRLLAALLEALDPFDLPWRVSPEVLPAMALREDQTLAVVDELAHALAQAEVEGGVMAFDDIHRIGDPRVFRFLDRLLRALPARWTIAMTTRVDPPLALARLLLEQELAEFRQDDLRFEKDEVLALLEAGRQPVSAERADKLLERTQGWVVGLSIEMLTQTHQAQPGPRAQRRVFEYLAQEVFEKLPPPMRTFLLRCSVLPVLTADRCAHVSGDARAAHWLAELERRELFVTVLDVDVLTLKLHDLFREFLERRLTKAHFEELPQLLRRAAEGEPDLVPRVGYLLRAGAAEEAAQEMLHAALPVIDASADAQLIRLIEQFPSPLREHSPELAFVRGLCAWPRYEIRTMHLSMLRAMEGFERSERWQLAIRARGLASVALIHLGRVSAAFELWDAVPRIPLEPATEAVSALLAFLRSMQYGPQESAPEHLMRLVRLIPSIGSELWTGFQVYYSYIGRRGMRAPMQALADALWASARDGHPQMKLLAASLRAWLALWQGDVDAARDLHGEVMQEAKWLGNPANVVVPNQVLAAMERNLRGDAAAAQAMLREIADAAGRDPQRKGRPIYINLLGALAGACEEWAAARQALRTLETSADKPEWLSLTLQEATLRAEIALHDGNAAEAASLLLPLVDAAKDADSYGANPRLRVALARAQLRVGAAPAAWDVLEPAVCQSMEAGQPLGLLLCGPAALEELALARWPEVADAPALAYLRGCAARARQLRSTTTAPSPTPADALLSDREMQVLERVTQGQSNKLIARELGLSPHTVKRHMARIFDKTGQSSRGQVASWYVHRSERRPRAPE